jgi:hypothetical protein
MIKLVELMNMVHEAKSPIIKNACLEAIKNGGRQFLDDKIALRILLEGYPQDEEVANLCIDIIKNREFLFSFLVRV